MSSAILPLLPSIPAIASSATAPSSSKADAKPAFGDLVDAAKDNAPADKAPKQDKTAATDTKDTPKPTTDETKADATNPAAAVEETDEEGEASKDDTKALTDLIDALSALDINLQTGQPIDPALLDKLNAAAQALAALAGATGQVNGAVMPDGSTKTPVDPASLLGQLSTKIGDLAAGVKNASPELADQLNALAQKLGSGEISAETLNKLGFTAELKAADPAINQAIASLASTKTVAAKDNAPTIKTPELKIPEATLLAPKDIAPPSAAALPTPVKASADADATLSKQENAKEQVRAASDDMAKATIDTGKDSKQTVPDALNTNATPVGARTELHAAQRVVQTAYQGPPSPINMPHMAFEIARQVHAGSNKFQIRLDPADLGRVDVSLDIDKNGTVNARLVVEKMETLDLMQRDQRSLEKALQQAGLDSSKTNLEFSLKQNSSGQQDRGNGTGLPSGSRSGSDDMIDAIPASVYSGSVSASGVNIFV